MICPKCQSTMRTFDRQGVHIDRCDGCQGIFLDRGELERVVNAEQRHYGVAPPPDPHQAPPHGYPQQHRGGYPDSPKGYRGGYPDSPKGYRGGYPDSPKGYRGGHGGYPDSPRGYGGRRKKSFLEGLFD
ncbi:MULTISPECIES: TFIIB-type zinc ribbon-containing protein [Nocardiopsis]|uniref:Zf-TFIIB domain-containing protein n=1 Tax=Nocardiopsis alborubida TaxID=146802 RepID=A0A7X6RSH8_9ACTN|nr:MULTISPECIES: zf-TFIIB domain-containing protein [Nocardiopsis]NKZ00343.1 zf-TFIIB domain-containing protein [Nocardiopsis alborubida]